MWIGHIYDYQIGRWSQWCQSKAFNFILFYIYVTAFIHVSRRLSEKPPVVKDLLPPGKKRRSLMQMGPDLSGLDETEIFISRSVLSKRPFLVHRMI